MTDKHNSSVVVPRELLHCYLSGEGGDWVEAGQELRALLAATPEQDVDVGEPVAYADPQAFINFTTGVATHEWMWAFSDNGLVPLYRHAQPPAKTVRLEMAHIVRAHMEIPYCPVLTSNQCHALAMKLNACLDEVARLNQNSTGAHPYSFHM